MVFPVYGIHFSHSPLHAALHQSKLRLMANRNGNARTRRSVAKADRRKSKALGNDKVEREFADNLPDQMPAWELFASTLLQYHALQRRIDGLPPRDFAGLVIDDAEVDRLLASLPGLDGPVRGQVASVVKQSEPQLDATRRRLHAEASGAVSGPFFSIAETAGVTGVALEVFAVLVSIELSPQKQRLLAYLQDNVSANRPWLSTLSEFFPDSPDSQSGSSAVANDSALSTAELISVEDTSPWGTRSVRLAERVVWAITGDHSPDPALPKNRQTLPATGSARGDHRLTVVAGADRQSRLNLTIQQTSGEKFLVVEEPKDDSTWRAVIREATVSSSAVIVESDGELRADTAYWLDRADHLPFAISSREEQPLERMPQVRPWREFHVPDGTATEADWQAALGTGPGLGHRLNRDQLRLVAKASAADGSGVDAAVRRLASGHLDRLALQVRPSRDWDDLVLPGRETTQLKELTERYRHGPTVYGEWGFKAVPSAGIVALFAGVSGTGKTLAAEVIAADLGLDVYKIDLSTVVSKYIGETEKNLEHIFDAAAAGNMVLFFDEADALFGKRSDVSDAHDRYANIEVAYLLQRLETYDGLVILATNLQGNIDQAFLRRIHVSVDFPMPSEQERLRIWRLSFPAKAPLESIDFEFLSKQFRISGGNIRNVVLTAAFLAAAAQSVITMTHVVSALQRELEKLGRLITPEEFGKYHSELTDS